MGKLGLIKLESYLRLYRYISMCFDSIECAHYIVTGGVTLRDIKTIDLRVTCEFDLADSGLEKQDPETQLTQLSLSRPTATLVE